MKTTTQKLQVLAMLFGLGLSAQVLAQSDILEDTDSILNSDQIDIDGAFEQPRESASQRIEKMRKQLEKKNEEMVSKRIEDMRIKEEQKLAKKLQKAFNGGNLGNVDEVSTVQAAPAKVVAAAPVVEETKEEIKRNKISPTFGVTNFSGDKIDFESKMTIGIQGESLLNDHISLGLGISYAAMDIQDQTNTFGGYNNLGRGREINFTAMNVDLLGKFYITGADRKIRPYVGGGLGYARSSLKYAQNDPMVFNGYNIGDESQKFSNFTGSISTGAEVNFTNTVGLSVDLKYARALTSGFSTETGTTNQNSDQLRLENLGQEIEDSNQISVGAGLVIKF